MHHTSIKLILLICFSVLHFQNLASQYIIYENYERLGWPDKRLYNLYGPVKSISHKNSSATGERGSIPFSDIGIIPFNEYQYDYTEFDSQGRIMVEGDVFKGEKLPSLVYTYNDEKMEVSIHHPSESNEYYLEHQYTGLSLIILEKHPGSDANTITYKLTYSNDSLLSNIDRYNFKQELRLSYSYQYNEKGNLIAVDEKLDGSTIRRHMYIYNENGQLVEKSWLSFVTIVAADDLIYKFKYQYDAYKNLISWEHKYHDNDPVKYTFTYTYDDKGNWITRQLWLDGKIQVITERTIEYY